MVRTKTKTRRIQQVKALLALAIVLGVGLQLLPGKHPVQRTPQSAPKVVTSQQLAKSLGSTQPEGPTQSTNSVVSTDTEKPKDTHSSTILQSGQYEQYRYTALLTPNDSQYSGSWYHQKLQTGRAWDVTTGSSNTVIAVIDTGFALSHQDLTNKWYTNAGEQGQTAVGGYCWTGSAVDKATNNCDDDQNGYVDDWRGWDFDSDDNNPQTGVTDPNGAGVQHGSVVSGIIAASSNNSVGNAGIDWQAKIMPLQVLGDDGMGYTFDIVAAIEYAADNGANVINMSLGGPDYDSAMLAAVNYATTRGVLVVAASGNCGNSSVDECASYTNTPGRMSYPARYDNVLSVGATNSSDARASFSSYGPELDVVAPGSSVGPLVGWSSSLQTNGYISSGSGTSFASPMVAGLAGLVRARLGNPTVMQLRTAILDSVDKVSGMSGQNWTDTYGFGRINAHKATLLAKAIAVPPSAIGTASIQSRQPPKGGLVRSSTGSVQSDEWIVLVCRVDLSDVCTGMANKDATTVAFTPTSTQKGDQVYYLFVQGSALPSGTSSLAVNSRNYAAKVVDVTR